MNKILITMSLVLFSNVGNAQLNYGVYGGLNISKITVTPEEDLPVPKSMAGFHIGAFGNYELSDLLKIQGDLEYSLQGSNDQDDGDYERIRLSYLNFTPLIVTTFNDNIHVFAGPRLGFLISGRFEEEEIDSGELKTYNAKALYSSTDFGLNIGAGYDFNEQLGVRLKYTIGLSDNNEDITEEAFYEVHQELKSSVLQLSLSYQL